MRVADRAAADRRRAGPRAGARPSSSASSDRTGVMSTVIAMAYASYAPVMHLSSSARHLEEIRRVTSRLSDGRHRERARPPRPPDALRRPRLLAGQGRAGPGAVPRRGRPPGGEAPGRPGDRVPRGGRRRALPARARRCRRGGAVARAGRAPRRRSRQTRSRSIQLETWRGMVRAGAGDADGMRDHLEKAVTMATGERPSVGALRSPGPPRPRGVAPGSPRRMRPTRPSSSSSSDRRHR